MTLSIVIPCYNEADNVAKLEHEFFPIVRQLIDAGSIGETATDVVEVVFVDDGSVDGTLPALKAALGVLQGPSLHVRFEQHAANQGLGSALRTGFAAAQGEVVVTTDSDGTYRFQEIPMLLECLTPEVSIVTASPYHPQGGVANVPAYRLVLSRGSSMLYRILVDAKIHTYTALFRAYRSDVIKTVPFAADGFLGGTELMVNAMLSGYRVAEYPTVLHSRAHGVSKAKLMRTVKAHLRYQRRILGYRLGLMALEGASPSKGDVQCVLIK